MENRKLLKMILSLVVIITLSGIVIKTSTLNTECSMNSYLFCGMFHGFTLDVNIIKSILNYDINIHSNPTGELAYDIGFILGALFMVINLVGVILILIIIGIVIKFGIEVLFNIHSFKVGDDIFYNDIPSIGATVVEIKGSKMRIEFNDRYRGEDWISVHTGDWKRGEDLRKSFGIE
jgi:hypothetical protein